jgi:hypothetical protein
MQEARIQAAVKQRVDLYWPVPDTTLAALVGPQTRRITLRERCELDQLLVPDGKIEDAVARAMRQPFLPVQPLRVQRSQVGEVNEDGDEVDSASLVTELTRAVDGTPISP